jgi:hypothetical protein
MPLPHHYTSLALTHLVKVLSFGGSRDDLRLLVAFKGLSGLVVVAEGRNRPLILV